LPGDTAGDLAEVHYRDYEFFRAIIERGETSGEIKCADTMTAALALQGIIDINIVSYLKMGNEKDFLSPARARRIAQMFIGGLSAGLLD
jgi:hypothetical protein